MSTARKLFPIVIALSLFGSVLPNWVARAQPIHPSVNPQAGAYSPASLSNPAPQAAGVRTRVYLAMVNNAHAAVLAPSQPGGTAPVGVPGSWNMVFQDEFNSDSLDTSKWHTCFWWATTTCSIESNHEEELYNAGDVLVQNGTLRLRAQKRNMTAWNGDTYHYTSGMVMTGGQQGTKKPGFTYTYGYAEARVKVPAGRGLWPAFWTLPVSYAWPPEIDIMEIIGDEPRVYNMNVHFTGNINKGTTWTGPDFSAGWHVIGLDWEPGLVVWYVDGVERWRYTGAGIPKEPMYLLLNLAVGGDWPGSPDGSTIFPSYFDVDYVRVWKKAG